MKRTLSSTQTLRLLFWECTAECNLNCAHCRRPDSGDGQEKDLSTAQGYELIGQLAGLGKKQKQTPMLVFSGGEPLCRQDLFDLIAKAKNEKIITALATNGTLIHQQLAGKSAKSGISRVAISLDGATAEVHNLLRRSAGAFEKAIEGIKHLRREEVSFQINMTLTKNNAGQLEQVCTLAKSLGAVSVHVFMLVPVGCGLKLARTDMLDAGQYEQTLKRIYQLNKEKGMPLKVTCGPHYQRIVRRQNDDNAEPTSKLAGCLGGIEVLFAGHNGDIQPCGYLPVKCGNVLEDNLTQIWYENGLLRQLRDRNNLKGKCRICGYRQVCGGCRARAYSVAGDYLAQEPLCGYVPAADG